MGIVAEVRGGRGRGWVGVREWKAICLRARPAIERCAPRLRQSPALLERTAFPMGEIDRQRGAGAGIAVRSAGAKYDHGGPQQDGHEVSQENGAALKDRGTVAIRCMVPPQLGQMAKSAAVGGRSPLV